MGGIFYLTFSVGPPRAPGPKFYYNTDPAVCQEENNKKNN